MDEYLRQNRRNWDDRAAIHVKDEAGGYQVRAFLAGGDNLHPIEDREIGDVKGLRIAHLQCHFGIDTLCLARRGASCVGLDFSPVALAAARDFQRRTGLDARFVEGNVYDARRLIDGEFDMVYVTWGAINWLPDISGWARVVASLLKPGGRLYLLEGHPSLMTLDEKSPDLPPAYDWRTPVDRPLTMAEELTYTGDTTTIANPVTHEWVHPLSDVINAVISSGLRLDWLNEHEELAWQFAPIMVPVEGKRRMWVLPAGFPRLPLAYSLQATRSS
ncbi:MAG: methyltransferase domain-containing protein [Alphaproteobacteria bacterium]|nr:methyltransferase domain-containing protein [Alphaproteobacteria bacterium]